MGAHSFSPEHLETATTRTDRRTDQHAARRRVLRPILGCCFLIGVLVLGIVPAAALLPASLFLAGAGETGQTGQTGQTPSINAALPDTFKKKKTPPRGEAMNYRKLTPEEEAVILRKGTEYPFSGEFNAHKEPGVYTCKRCGAELYRSGDKFDSGCGWPSFDDEIPGAVKRHPDADGRRVEIVCAACGAHLGHVFQGELLTPKNVRHCVNSISLLFRPAAAETKTPEKTAPTAAATEKNAPTTEKAYFAGGCFWGVEYWFKKAPGVLSVASGYMGGTLENPDYKAVCRGDTGHAETVEVVFDPSKISFGDLTRLFFEIHDFTQVDGQGPDIGTQYRSAVFCRTPEQLATVQAIIKELGAKGYKVATVATTTKAPFWKAEAYHQNYYAKTGGTPYCHAKRKVF